MKNLTPNYTVPVEVVAATIVSSGAIICGKCVIRDLCEVVPTILRYHSGDVYTCFEVKYEEGAVFAFLVTTDDMIHGPFLPEQLGFTASDGITLIVDEVALKKIETARRAS